jgi:hypothetical protein
MGQFTEALDPPLHVERHWKLTCPYADPAHEAHLLDGLRKARLPEK